MVITVSAALFLAAILALIWINKPGGKITVSIEGVQTNAAGHTEYLFKVHNKAWDCALFSDVQTLSGRNEWHGEARSIIKLQQVKKGETILIPVQPSTTPWKVRFVCNRKQIPALLQGLESLNQILTSRFSFPEMIKVERLITVDTVKINPRHATGTGPVSGLMRSDKHPDRVVRLISVPKHQEGIAQEKNAE